MTKSRLRLIPLEDRCTPASFVGNVITLDDGGEQLTISTSTSGEYTLSSTVDVNNEGTTAKFTPTGPVSIVDSVGSTSVLFANSTAAYAHDFSVVLNDGSQGVRFDGGIAFGANNLSVTVDRNIAVNPLALVTITTGDIDFAANMQANPRIGEFIGVDVQGQVTSTGSGTVSVRGRGGLLNIYGMFGVQVLGTAAIISSGTGSLTVTGTGGGGSGDASIGVHVARGARILSGNGELTLTGTGGAGAGQGNYGVLVQNVFASITSTGGNVNIHGKSGVNGTKSYGVGVYVNDGGNLSAGSPGKLQVTGTGGGTGASSHNNGVFVVGKNSSITSGGGAINITGTGGDGTVGGSTGVHVTDGGVIFAGGAGNNTVNGTGGAGSGGTYNVGVMVQGSGSAISSTSGNVAVEGTAGANGSGYNIGVMVYNAGNISTSGSGTVNVKGTGKGPNNGRNYGVFVLEEGATIASNGGVTVEGITPTSGNMATEAVFVSNEGSITGTGISNVTVTADALSIDSQGGSISASSGTVTIQPRTTGFRTRLGGGFDNFSSQPTLNLVGAELARITAGTLVIGSSTAGEIRVTNPVAGIQNVSNLTLLTGGDIVSERNTTFNAGVAQLTLGAGGFIHPPSSNTGYQTFTAGSTNLAAGSKVAVEISGQLADQYSHLDVTGALNLNNATLALSGNFIPVKASMFTLVTAGNLTGTFTNAPESTVVVFNGVSLRISYTATSVTATVV